ncbi:MAG: GNAT family N-acetyltransferase [Ancalomicrobiaceae bacterium]|nr:GNAT family N-acetyltransferase [Ancalomicrobiaceae bacterium]
MAQTLARPAIAARGEAWQLAWTAAAALRLVRASSFDDPALLDDLDAIVAAGGQVPLFQSRVWLKGVADYLVNATGSDIRIYRLVDPATGRASAILPVVVTREGGLNVARLLGDGVSDVLGAIVAPHVTPSTEAAEAVLRLVSEDLVDVDLLRLTHLAPTIDGRANLLALAEGAFASADATYPVDLEPASATVVTARSACKTYQKQWRKLERRDGIAINWLTEAGEIAAGFDRMVQMRRARFARLSRADTLREEASERFYRAMALAPEGDRPAQIAELVVAGKPVGYIYRIDDGQRFSTVICAIDDTVGNAYAPALILFTKLFEKAVAEGYSSGDMGTGSMPYKLRFARGENRLLTIERGLSLKGWIATVGFALVRAARAWCKRRPALVKLRCRLKRRAPKPAHCAADTE